MTGSLERQQWLEIATEYLAAHVIECGGKVPENIRVSIGFPRSSRKAVGQCWYASTSSDEHHEIFVSPTIDNSTHLLATLCHELIHTACGAKAGHGRKFKKLATECGLTGRMTATVAGEDFERWAEHFIENHGDYPSGHIKESHRAAKKQSTRLIKVECEDCGHTVRTTRKWLDLIGPPICPCNNKAMQHK